MPNSRTCYPIFFANEMENVRYLLLHFQRSWLSWLPDSSLLKLQTVEANSLKPHHKYSFWKHCFLPPSLPSANFLHKCPFTRETSKCTRSLCINLGKQNNPTQLNRTDGLTLLVVVNRKQDFNCEITWDHNCSLH